MQKIKQNKEIYTNRIKIVQEHQFIKKKRWTRRTEEETQK